MPRDDDAGVAADIAYVEALLAADRAGQPVERGPWGVAAPAAYGPRESAWRERTLPSPATEDDDPDDDGSVGGREARPDSPFQQMGHVGLGFAAFWALMAFGASEEEDSFVPVHLLFLVFFVAPSVIVAAFFYLVAWIQRVLARRRGQRDEDEE